MIHNDHLGTPQKMTDSFGTVVWAADYKPFGEATVTVSTITNNLRFPGQYFDAESGISYNYYRDYNSAIGRYVEADPIGLRGGINPYLYSNANSIRFTDPRGLLLGGNNATIGLPPGKVISPLPPARPLGPPTSCTSGCHSGGKLLCMKFDSGKFWQCLQDSFADSALTGELTACYEVCKLCASAPVWYNPACGACAVCATINAGLLAQCKEEATTYSEPDKCGMCPK